MSDKITIDASEAVGELREAIRVALAGEHLVIARFIPPGSVLPGGTHVVQGFAYGPALLGDEFDSAIDNLARNIVMRLLGRGWGA